MSEKHKKTIGRQPPAGPRRDLDRNGNNGRKARRSRSRSPIKSKLMAMAMSSAAKAKAQGNNDKPRRESSREREISKRKMRMDELNDKREQRTLGKSTHRSPEHKSRSETGPKKKSAMELDKVVKKARQERNHYWDKKVLEAEEKDPQRWGHSGFKELYQKDFKRPPSSPKRQRRSRSMSSPGRNQSPRFRKRSSRSRSRSISRSRRSRSRSPIQRATKGRKESRRSFSHSPEFTSSKFKPINNRTLGSRPKNQTDSKLKSRSTNSDAFKSKSGGSRDIKHAPTLKGKGMLAGGSGNGNIPSMKSRLGHRVSRRSSSFSSSDSSRSRSRGFPPVKRPGDGMKNSMKTKDIRNRRAGMNSDSSSSNSSDDEDVLQLHARGKGRSPSLSHSDSQSSSSSRSINRNRKGPHSSTSSSMSGSSSDSDSDASIGTKPTNSVGLTRPKAGVKKLPGNVNPPPQRQTTSKPIAKKPNPPASDSDSSSSDATAAPVKIAPPIKPAKKVTAVVVPSKIKPAATTEATKVISKPKTVPVKKKSVAAAAKPVVKSASESGETESETDSSSDSDSEPRMTLSERFAKLAQMGTDKREMAKPILSVNEIDTKMRVVKDFRNPEAPKMYVTGQGAPPDTRSKIRPKTPEHPEGEKRYSSDERRRHFERMYRDEPAERPLDWTDARVRYSYYKERGCFDERPITFEEYIKWEDWYQKYREWLEREEYYSRMTGPPPPAENYGTPPPFNNNGGRGGGRPGRPNYPQQGRRVDRMSGPTPLSNRPHFGRPENNGYMEGDIMGRRIDRTPGGSLVVNIRQQGNGNGNNFGGPRGMGRRVGMLRQR